MVFGMLPIALASGTASEWKNGLAWVIIGGLTSSMLLTVFLVPVVYYAVDALKERFSAPRSNCVTLRTHYQTTGSNSLPSEPA
jgi:HAE1 family hydrophobic/amphiphilic exporter-1